MSVLASSSVDAQETAGVHYKYVAQILSYHQKKKQLLSMIFRQTWRMIETYYLVYKLNSQNQLAEFYQTGRENERGALVMLVLA